MSYTGDVSVKQAWQVLSSDQDAVLVDVRTQAEWAFVGICDLSEVGKTPLLVSWQEFPHMEINPNFIAMIEAQLSSTQASPTETSAKAPSKNRPIYFLCRSGVRSKSAASAMVAAGYSNCFNILEGFEGDKDGAGHRGLSGGWKAEGLPWQQN